MEAAVEKIIKAQKETAEQIAKMVVNYNKDSESRKTEDYFEKRLRKLEDFWAQFKQLHRELQKLIDDNHPYHMEKLYEKTEEIYKTFLRELLVNQSKPSDETASVTLSLDSASALPPAPPMSLAASCNATSSSPQAVPRTSAAPAASSINHVPTTFPSLNNPAPGFPPYNYGSITDPSNLAQPFQETLRLNNIPKLPPIKIPKFSGDYREWKPFIDIFSNVIHNNPYISNVEKIQYLLYHLEGDARRVVAHLQINGNNYETALRLIHDRFNNNRKIITTYINTIIDAKKTEHRCQEDVIMLYDLIRECLEALKNLSCNTDEWSPLIVCLAMRKLDIESLRLFEESLSKPREMPCIEELLKFLERRYQVLDCIKNSKPQKFETPSKNPKRSYHMTMKHPCSLCGKDHNIYQCTDFKKKDVQERHAFVTKKNLCLNCLLHNKAEKCKSQKSCSVCKKKHHTLLHRNSEAGTRTHNKDSATFSAQRHEERDTTDVISYHVSNTRIPNVLLPTAIVRVQNHLGQAELLRALIDPGSQVSLITEESVQVLKLQKQKIRATILGVGEAETAKTFNKVNFKIKLRFQNAYLSVEAFVLPKLNSLLPETPIKKINMSQYGDIMLADTTFNTPGQIDLLLGAEVYARILTDGFKEGQPAAQNTKLGWILFGSTPDVKKETTKVSSFLSLAELDEQLQKFWEFEDSSPPRQVEEEDEMHYERTTRRDEKGRYIVQLPVKSNGVQLGESRNKAMARLLQVERKLKLKPDDMREYNEFLSEYMKLGHMSPARPFRGDVSKVFYLPHHAVFKRESTTTKLRVVFDASSKTASGSSLNDILLPGSKLQQDLTQIVLRWRKYRYVFTADIEKMFRQIQVAEEDRDYQRILWRPVASGPIQEYRLNTVTYGTAPATYLAVRTLRQLAEDEGLQFPVGKRVLINDFYVDDMLTGTDTKEEARTLQHEIITLLRKGNFNLRKWTANNEDLLEDIPENIREKGILEIKEQDTIKALGIHWNPKRDEFQFRLKVEDLDSNLTKRQLLSRISTIFDPLGWLAPVTLKAKLMMQSLWKTGTDWDELVPSEVSAAWKELKSELPELEKIRIPRWTNHRKGNEIQIHGFCDASLKAYGAVVYSRTIDSFRKVHVTLLTAKTKVAPLKQKVSLPRMELCGALLLAQLLKATIGTLELDESTITAWCDSEITLAWIAKNPNQWSTFVANRVSEIHSLIPKNVWKHVSTHENPADVASRGSTPSKLQSHHLWWRGPLWLSQSQEAWPVKKLSLITDEEASKIVKTLSTTATTTAADILTCSSFSRQIRVIAYCRRFIHNFPLPVQNRKSGHLTCEEIQQGKRCIIRIVQKDAFSEEIEALRKKRPLKKSSKILLLHPFLDEEGILRVGGRIQNSTLCRETKHQILLPQKHHITNLVIEHAHRQTLHGGTQLTLNYIRSQFWIINSKSIVQSRNRRCITCVRHGQHSAEQLMGNLPAVRVTPSPPFSHSGVDYAGPFLTKMSKGRGTKTLKGYIALFICMVTKAVHLELVSDLTTDAFLAAYKRFVARRGNCIQIYSDNGTNFVGANNKLDKNLRDAINSSSRHMAEIIANNGTEWNFIPPSSPHIGGLWEAGVKSVKRHLKRILGETLLTYEEFTTVLYQVEACLNSRPIGQQSSDPSDLEALTPGHFLIGRPLMAPPEPDISDKEVYQRWKLVTRLQQDIWKRWSEEYLTLLQQRSKWTTTRANPAIGELVIIKSDILPPQKWALGRICNLHPGEDGLVRIVSVKSKGGIKKIPLKKLCQLPISITTTEDPTTTNINAMATHIKAITRKPRNEPSTGEPELWSQPEHFDKLKRDDGKRTAPSTFAPPEAPKKRRRIAPCTWASKLLHSTLLILYWLTVAFAQDYEIVQPKSGIYVENLGHTRIKRGNLRLEITTSIDEVLKDQAKINKTWNQIKDMCQQTKELTQTTHCDVLFRHMSSARDDLLASTREIVELSQQKSRKRRGILGKMLTSIFGVNDEVYTDIDILQRNQQGLLQASNQQMLLLNTRINQTSSIIWDKLKQFDSRMSRVLASIKEMRGWYMQADHNRISIEVLATYMSAENYYSELQKKYSKWLNAIHHHGHLLDFISTADINSIIQNTTKLIGPGFIVTKTPQPYVNVVVENNTMKLYGYLNIVETNVYDLMHATPIPQRIENNSFVTMELGSSTIAVDFNQQSYFTLAEDEISSCITSGNMYLCTPSIVHNIEDSPSCLVDAIYNRHEKTDCKVRGFQLTGITWKALKAKNSWLYITTAPKVVAIICNGKRVDLALNNTGIIHLSSSCFLKTRELILKTSMERSMQVVTSHIIETNPAATTIHFNEPPAVLKSGALIGADQQLLDDIQPQSVEPFHLRALTKTAVIYSSASTATITISLLLAILLYKYWSAMKGFLTSSHKANPEPQPEGKHGTLGISQRFDRVLASAGPQHVQT